MGFIFDVSVRHFFQVVNAIIKEKGSPGSLSKLFEPSDFFIRSENMGLLSAMITLRGTRCIIIMPLHSALVFVSVLLFSGQNVSRYIFLSAIISSRE